MSLGCVGCLVLGFTLNYTKLLVMLVACTMSLPAVALTIALVTI